jgi:hypothetical protein
VSQVASLTVGTLPPSLEVLARRWHRAPRRWGHPLHSICSYFAMFPPQLARVFIRWLTTEGEAVYDPFSGRGTVPLEASLEGRVGYGSDLNPLAAVLTGAKVHVPSSLVVERRVAELESSYQRPDLRRVPTAIRMLYSKETLARILYLRDELDVRWSSVDRLLVAATLGLLHANHSAGGATRGFSVSMPNTFAMSPRYVHDYIEKHDLVAPDVDVFGMLRRRLDRLGLPANAVDGGRFWRQDASRTPPAWLRKAKVRLVLTSPPYLQVIKYAKYNWVRLWFLRREPREVDESLMATGSLSRYRGFLSSALAQLAKVVEPDGFTCMVIGDVRRDGYQLNLAQDIWENVAQPNGWHLHGMVVDSLPTVHKVSRIWKQSRGRATKTDRILVLSRTSGVRLPTLSRVDWQRPPSWCDVTPGQGGS